MSEYFVEALSGELNKEASRQITKTMLRRVMRRGRKARSQAERGAGLKGVISKHSSEKVAGRKEVLEAIQRVLEIPFAAVQGAGAAGRAMVKNPKTTGIAAATGATGYGLGRHHGKKKHKKTAAAAAAGKLVKSVIRGANKAKTGYTDSQQIGVDDPRFGGGKGLKNLGGKKAPTFTDKVNPTDMPNAFGAGHGLKMAMMDDAGDRDAGAQAYGTGAGSVPKVSKAIPKSSNPAFGAGAGVKKALCEAAKKKASKPGG